MNRFIAILVCLVIPIPIISCSTPLNLDSEGSTGAVSWRYCDSWANPSMHPVIYNDGFIIKASYNVGDLDNGCSISVWANEDVGNMRSPSMQMAIMQANMENEEEVFLDPVTELVTEDESDSLSIAIYHSSYETNKGHNVFKRYAFVWNDKFCVLFIASSGAAEMPEFEAMLRSVKIDGRDVEAFTQDALSNNS